MIERRLRLKKGTELHPITITLSAPYWIIDGEEAACAVAIHGLFGQLVDVRGVDPYQAMELAMQLVEQLLQPHEKQLYWPDGTNHTI